ncbi:unnamed protein product [Caretta caretta]
MERHLAASPEDPFLCGACREKREEPRALEDHRARGAFVRSCICLLREMDRCSRFFYALEKMRGAKKHVTCLLAEDSAPLTDLGALGGTSPQSAWGDRDRLELPLTLAEFSEALRRMPTNKSPGMDGLTVEFCHAFWDILGPDLATLWAESLQGGVLPLSCRRAVLALLPKKRHLCDLRNWRPVSLLSMDYKIVVKAISLRLGRLTGLVLQELELRLVLSAYANDVLLLVQDPGDLARVEACQAIYSAASSARVNWVKSSGLAVGDWRRETHTDPTAEDSWRLDCGDRVYFSRLTVRTAGVVTLFSPDLQPEVLGVAEAVPGRLLHFRVRMEGLVVNLVNIYAPTLGSEWLQFYQRASAFLSTLDPHECLVLGEDFNTTLEERDRSGTERCPATADVLQETVEHHSLVDVWHDHRPDGISTFEF